MKIINKLLLLLLCLMITISLASCDAINGILGDLGMVEDGENNEEEIPDSQKALDNLKKEWQKIEIKQESSEEDLAYPFGGWTDVDVIIVARGGGSIEDLMPFNDEELARIAYICNKPLISAVLMSDLRLLFSTTNSRSQINFWILYRFLCSLVILFSSLSK